MKASSKGHDQQSCQHDLLLDANTLHVFIGACSSISEYNLGEPESRETIDHKSFYVMQLSNERTGGCKNS